MRLIAGGIGLMGLCRAGVTLLAGLGIAVGTAFLLGGGVALGLALTAVVAVLPCGAGPAGRGQQAPAA